MLSNVFWVLFLFFVVLESFILSARTASIFYSFCSIKEQRNLCSEINCDVQDCKRTPHDIEIAFIRCASDMVVNAISLFALDIVFFCCLYFKILANVGIRYSITFFVVVLLFSLRHFFIKACKVKK